MRLYYNVQFKSVNPVKEVYCDALAFTKNGHRYSLDIVGEHDFSVENKDGVCSTSGRVKGDMNSIIDLDKEEEYKELTYQEVAAMLQDAEGIELVLCAEEEQILDFHSYEIDIMLNNEMKFHFEETESLETEVELEER